MAAMGLTFILECCWNLGETKKLGIDNKVDSKVKTQSQNLTWHDFSLIIEMCQMQKPYG